MLKTNTLLNIVVQKKNMINSTTPHFPLLSGDFYTTGFDALCGNLIETKKLKVLAEKMKWETDFNTIEEQILEKNHVVIVTDTRLKIVHATANIQKMNGYLPEEVLGKSPKLFQGEKTSLDARNRISQAIQKQVAFEEVLINYRKDKSEYNCWIKGLPIKNNKGKVVNFIAFEKLVA